MSSLYKGLHYILKVLVLFYCALFFLTVVRPFFCGLFFLIVCCLFMVCCLLLQDIVFSFILCCVFVPVLFLWLNGYIPLFMKSDFFNSQTTPGVFEFMDYLTKKREDGLPTARITRLNCVCPLEGCSNPNLRYLTWAGRFADPPE